MQQSTAVCRSWAKPWPVTATLRRGMQRFHLALHPRHCVSNNVITRNARRLATARRVAPRWQVSSFWRNAPPAPGRDHLSLAELSVSATDATLLARAE